jgi:hypothetical protein
MQTMAELQAEADRRSAELTRAAQAKAAERAAIYEEINRRDAEAKACEHEESSLCEKQDNERRYKQAEYALGFEGQVLSHLKSVAQATQSTADSVRQIRNFIAAVLVFSLVVGILLVLVASRV